MRHRSTTHVGPSCYLQDLSTLDSEHGKGVGRALIEAVYDAARRHRAEYVQWLADARDGSHSAARPTTPARHERQDLQKDAPALSTVDRVFNSLSFNASTTRHVHPDRRGDVAPNSG
nr:GNAT family N-acetyltransferase [Burkholderia cenocepacia]